MRSSVAGVALTGAVHAAAVIGTIHPLTGVTIAAFGKGGCHDPVFGERKGAGRGVAVADPAPALELVAIFRGGGQGDLGARGEVMLTILAAIDARRVATDAAAACHGDRQALCLFLFAAYPKQQESDG
ncbi:MAG: hypothetical protein PVJ19_14120 [Desulfobacteraceae bacterium]